ncbi:MAG: hypothetical protein HYV07_29335 [Deltaproteobacteria bacterium]|nr:hypothetical protein [Deltaproteobacteria bacterium]
MTAKPASFRTRRDRAVEAWVECYQRVATTLEGLFRLGGRADLADRVRPTARAAAGEEAGLEGPAEVPNPGAS